MQDCIFRHKNTIFNLSNLLKGIKLANHYCSASRFDAFLGQFGVMSISGTEPRVRAGGQVPITPWACICPVRLWLFSLPNISVRQ